jgi:hypothetical protein
MRSVQAYGPSAGGLASPVQGSTGPVNYGRLPEEEAARLFQSRKEALMNHLMESTSKKKLQNSPGKHASPMTLKLTLPLGMKKKPSFVGDKRQSSKKTFDSESKADKRLQNLSGGGFDVSMKQLRLGAHQQASDGGPRQVTPRQRPIVSSGPTRRAPEAIKPVLAFRKFDNAQAEDNAVAARGHASVGDCYEDEPANRCYDDVDADVDAGAQDRRHFRSNDQEHGDRGFSNKNKGAELFERGAEKARMKYSRVARLY